MKRFALVILTIVSGAIAIAWGVQTPGSAIPYAIGGVLLAAGVLIAVSRGTAAVTAYCVSIGFFHPFAALHRTNRLIREASDVGYEISSQRLGDRIIKPRNVGRFVMRSES